MKICLPRPRFVREISPRGGVLFPLAVAVAILISVFAVIYGRNLRTSQEGTSTLPLNVVRPAPPTDTQFSLTIPIYVQENLDFFNQYATDVDIAGFRPQVIDLVSKVTKGKKTLVFGGHSNVEAMIALAKQNGIKSISYNLETAMTMEELVQKEQEFYQIAKDNGMEATFAPVIAKLMNNIDNYGASFALYTDAIGLQSQHFQMDPNYKQLIGNMVDKLKIANPSVKVCIQVSVNPPDKRDITAEEVIADIDEIKDKADSIAIYYVPTPDRQAVMEQVFKHFRATPRFGINYVYQGMERYQKGVGGSEQEYIIHQDEKIAGLGSLWVRSAGPKDLTSAKWDVIEPQKDVFDFTLHDYRIRDTQSKGIRVLESIDLGPRSYPDYAKASTAYGFDDQLYLDFLNKVVERYDGDGNEDMPGLAAPVIYWEVGNEPGAQSFPYPAKDYAHLLRISHQSIKANCPDCQVLIAGFAVGQLREEDKYQKALTYFDTVLGESGNSFDIANYHEYTNDCDFLTYYHVKGFKDLLSKYGLVKPFWITEANTKLQKEGKGKYAGMQVKHTLAEQAQDIIKRSVVAFDSGVDVFFWHGLDENNYGVGLFDENETPKPVYYNLKLMMERIGNFTSVQRIDLGNSSLYFYKFNSTDTVTTESEYVLWSEAETTVTFNLSQYFSQSNIELTYAITEMGKTSPRVETMSTSSVPTNKTPLFIRSQPAETPTPRVCNQNSDCF